MNRLAHETSPYLLQHAHNPVDWYPWGEEALERAKAEDKPILVSIGYAACHWCHVMERECFERDEVAALMNRSFINIKVDREERPDLDHIYMDALQAMTGSGGWPLNVFLTPDLQPFYGGTYFPPESAYGRPSWRAVLDAVSRSFREKRADLEAEAKRLTDYLRKSGDIPREGTTGLPEGATPKAVRDAFMAAADREEGGFGPAPKFPQTFSLTWLLRYAYFTGDQESRAHVCLSLDKMLDGGIYDQLGGGLARYSTDRRWLVPHFEKMLYDNALLVSTLCEAFALTRLGHYRAAVSDIVAFVVREWQSPEGGFYSAWDADSEGVEGKFYTWTKEEIDAILGEDSEPFCAAYGVTDQGNWEGVNILERAGKTAGAGQDQAVENARRRLFEARSRRVRPLLDDKQILGWNALMNKAFAQAYAVTGETAYREVAVRHMDFMLEAFRKHGDLSVPAGEPSSGPESGLGHVYKSGQLKHWAFLDDYACLIQALLHLQEITGDLAYALRAKELTEYVCAHFSDPATGFFFYTHEAQTDILLRKKEIYDGATPSGNSVMAWNLFYLGTLLDRAGWKGRALAMMRAMALPASRYPTSFGIWADLALTVHFGWNEIVVTGKDFERLLSDVLRTYLPNRVLQSGLVENDHFPLLKGKITSGSQPLIYLCRDFKCGPPLPDARALQQQIQKMAQ